MDQRKLALVVDVGVRVYVGRPTMGRPTSMSDAAMRLWNRIQNAFEVAQFSGTLF